MSFASSEGRALARMTPRFNPEVNGYWMCDIGRFDYHWIEGDERLHKPLLRSAAGALEPAEWRTRSDAGGSGEDGGRSRARCASCCPRMPRSRNCSSSAGWAARSDCLKKAWRSAGVQRVKPQPPNAKFKIPPIDAPNVTGARDLGFPIVSTAAGEADLNAFRVDIAVRQGRRALRVRSGSCRIDRRPVVDHRSPQGRPAEDAHRAWRADDRAGQGRRHRAAGCGVGREGRHLRQRRRPAAGSVRG